MTKPKDKTDEPETPPETEVEPEPQKQPKAEDKPIVTPRLARRGWVRNN